MRLSWTLSKYIFLDLLKVFMMTNGALAGIMSFGGMLKPLMQGGLEAGQVVEILTYLSPAMSAYTFPIAALFAATVVYGRLSADNEIVAARAGGISHLSIAMPAIALGCIVSLASMAILCFIVPKYTLKVEKVIYSNIAQILATQIARNHQIDRLTDENDTVVYAQSAHVLEPEGGTQRLVLVGPMIVRYSQSPTDKRLKIPLEFYTARQATILIRQEENTDRVQFSFTMDGGMRLPRDASGGAIAGIDAFEFGPIERGSMIKENTKFMVLEDLQQKLREPWTSRRVQTTLEQFINEDQQIGMADIVDRELRETGSVTFDGDGETYRLSAAPGTTITKKPDEIILTSPDPKVAAIVLRQTGGVPQPIEARATRLRLRSAPLTDEDAMHVQLKLDDVTIKIGADTSTGKSFERSLVVPMPPEVKAMEQYRRNPYRYASRAGEGTRNQNILGRDLVILRHDIYAELNGRSAFAVSCLVLAVIGCVMGMLFRSGNFLSAFAISFIPALMCITLIVAGQRTAGDVSWRYWEADSSLTIGLTLIWSGVTVIGTLAFAMLWRLNRT